MKSIKPCLRAIPGKESGFLLKFSMRSLKTSESDSIFWNLVRFSFGTGRFLGVEDRCRPVRFESKQGKRLPVHEDQTAWWIQENTESRKKEKGKPISRSTSIGYAASRILILVSHRLSFQYFIDLDQRYSKMPLV